MRALAAVIGWPVSHSRSPAMHNAAYRALGIDAVYLALPVQPERVAEAVAGVRALGLIGVNVTVPHKQAVMAGCDVIAPEARRVGAVNTIVVRDGQLHGFNTDIDGFRASLGGAKFARAVVLGAGGAARAVVAALAPAPVVVIARDVAKSADLSPISWTSENLARALDGADLLIDATSAALDDQSELALPAPIPLDRLARDALVGSLVYHREPGLLRAARSQGLRTLDGTEMLVHQAALAFTLMTDRPAPIDVMRAAGFPRGAV